MKTDSEPIMKGKLVYAVMEDGSIYHGDSHGPASVKIVFDDQAPIPESKAKTIKGKVRNVLFENGDFHTFAGEPYPEFEFTLIDGMVVKPIPESKAEQEEKKNCEGKVDDQCTNPIPCRSEHLTATEIIVRRVIREELRDFHLELNPHTNKVAYSPYFGDPIDKCQFISGTSNVHTTTQLPPTEKPSPSPKTKRVPLKKEHFDGRDLIWIRVPNKSVNYLATAIGESAITFNGDTYTFKELASHGEYSYDRVIWRNFFVEVADEE